MSNIENAAMAIHMANTDALQALILALSAGGALDPSVFKDKLDYIQNINKGADVLNQEYYDKAIDVLLAASRGQL